jgi:hypothetical protein
MSITDIFCLYAGKLKALVECIHRGDEHNRYTDHEGKAFSGTSHASDLHFSSGHSAHVADQLTGILQ